VENSPLKIWSFIFTAGVILICSAPSFAQKSDGEKTYTVTPAPDVWFNSVDGIRVGVRLRGQQPGTFREGPHRLDAGLWLGTFIPTYPVSYFVSFTEPIPSISGFNSEGNVRLRSSIRTGYHNHSISFNKRWQPGFEEKNYRELSVSLRAEQRFEDEYLLFPQIWQNDWLYVGGVDFRINNNNSLGRYQLNSTTSINFAGAVDPFINSRFDIQQFIPLDNGFAVRARIFTGLSSNNTAPEYLFTHSFQPYEKWDELGATRAKGTIPTSLVRDGFIQVAGGANLRGYTHQDIELLDDGEALVFTSIGTFNAELQYPNPVNKWLESIPFAGLLDFRTHLFFDSGTSLGISDREEDRLLSDAGLGFTLNLNIPDYLGKSRGFAIRYEIPFWLSNPDGDDSEFKFRSLIGIGAIISL